jgi:hypothetical protein
MQVKVVNGIIEFKFAVFSTIEWRVWVVSGNVQLPPSKIWFNVVHVILCELAYYVQRGRAILSVFLTIENPVELYPKITKNEKDFSTYRFNRCSCVMWEK